MMEADQHALFSLDVRVLMLSVAACTFISFFAATLLAMKLNRQPLCWVGVAGYALSSTVVFALIAVLVGNTFSGEGIFALVGLLLGLVNTQWLLAKRLLPWLRRRQSGASEPVNPAAWRIAVITVPVSAIILTVAGFAQMALLFSPA